MVITDTITQDGLAWYFINLSQLLLEINRGDKWEFKFSYQGLKG